MNSAIQTALQQYIDSFMDTVAERFEINREALNELWSETQKKKFKPVKPARRRKPVPTAYILFCKDERPKLNGMSFAETAKELGLRWKAAPNAVKLHYKQQHDDLLRQRDAESATTPTTITSDDEHTTTNDAVITTTTTTDDEHSDDEAVIATATITIPEKEKPKRKPKKALEIPDDITDERERALWPEFAALTITELRTQCDHNNIKKSKNRNDMIQSLIAHRIALEDGNTQLESDSEEEDEDMP